MVDPPLVRDMMQFMKKIPSEPVVDMSADYIVDINVRASSSDAASFYDENLNHPARN